MDSIDCVDLHAYIHIQSPYAFWTSPWTRSSRRDSSTSDKPFADSSKQRERCCAYLHAFNLQYIHIFLYSQTFPLRNNPRTRISKHQINITSQTASQRYYSLSTYMHTYTYIHTYIPFLDINYVYWILILCMQVIPLCAYV